MNHLFIVRHAHSPFSGDSDHQRPLSDKGVKQATAAGEFIKQALQSTELPSAPEIICSDAKRTQTTAANIAAVLGCKQPQAADRFYHATVGDWCDAITTQPAAMILVGHNPTVSQLVNYLTQQNLPGMVPASVAHCTLEIAADGLKLPAQLVNFFQPNTTS